MIYKFLDIVENIFVIYISNLKLLFKFIFYKEHLDYEFKIFSKLYYNQNSGLSVPLFGEREKKPNN